MTLGIARGTQRPAVVDHPEVCGPENPRGNNLLELFFHLMGCCTLGETDPVGDAEDMCVHRHGGFAERLDENDIGSLSPHAGKRYQFIAGIRNPPLEVVSDHPARRDDVVRLGMMQANRGYDPFYVREIRFRKLCGCWIFSEQGRRD